MKKTFLTIITAISVFTTASAEQVVCQSTPQGITCPVQVPMQPAGQPAPVPQDQGIPATNASVYIAGMTAAAAVLMAGMNSGAIGHRWHHRAPRFRRW